MCFDTLSFDKFVQMLSVVAAFAANMLLIYNINKEVPN